MTEDERVPKEAGEFRDYEPLHAQPLYEQMFVKNIASEVTNVAFPKEKKVSTQRTVEGLKQRMLKGVRHQPNLERNKGDNPAKDFRDELIALGSAKTIEQHCIENNIFYPNAERVREIEEETAETYDTVTTADTHTEDQIHNPKGH